MVAFLLRLIVLVLVYLAFSLNTIVARIGRLDNDVQRIVENQISTVNDIARIARVLKFNSKQEKEDFSEARIEELLWSGNWIETIKYRREMSTDILDDALDYVRGTGKRIGVSVPGDEKSQAL